MGSCVYVLRRVLAVGKYSRNRSSSGFVRACVAFEQKTRTAIITIGTRGRYNLSSFGSRLVTEPIMGLPWFP